jgi:pyruvate,water dikinase
VGGAVRSGRARVISSVKELDLLQPGEILVTQKTDPDWEPVMKRSAGIVTDRGGRTCHAAIVARELGIPAVVGCETASLKIVNGQIVSVSSGEGDEGFVYEGEVRFKTESISKPTQVQTKTKILMNISRPEDAFRLSFIPNDGVGLCRMEFMISGGLRIHPMALARYPLLKDPKVVQAIDQITSNFDDKRDYFIERLSEQLGMIAAAFYPKEVIVRLSDFKSNEYGHLLGGSEFENDEENPMIGFRGSIRYYHERYQEGFALECRAIHRARLQMGFKNIKVMVPFCRTLSDAKNVIAALRMNGLERGKDELQILMMCEIPSNVILMKDFCEFFDGISIGSNDLTQLMLGIDRDSEWVAPLFDERDPSVQQMIAFAIKEAHRAGKRIGICGQAPSDYPEFARFLVEQGIDSISLNPDSVMRMFMVISESESRGTLNEREKYENFTSN